MKDNEINVAVAECCGWTKLAPSQLEPNHLRGFPPNDNGRDWVPNFANSRDAMASALATLRDWNLFLYHLDEFGKCETNTVQFAMKFALRQTPKQLAIAFLKAKGKWRDA